MLDQISPNQLQDWGQQHVHAGPLVVLDVREPWELQTASVKPVGFDLVSIPIDRKSTRLNSSHVKRSRMPSSA